jgi:hypothetical protein
MSGDLLKKVYGRDILSLYLPDGRVLLPSSLTKIFSKIIYELKTNKVIDLQVVQYDLSNLEIRIVFDEKLRDIGPSVDDIFSFIKHGFKEIFGSNVKIVIKEVKKVNRADSRIVTKIDREKFKVTGYL